VRPRVSAANLGMVVKTPFRVVEGIVDCGVEILGRLPIARRDDDLASRNDDVESDPIRIAMALVPMRRFERHFEGDDPGVTREQFIGTSLDVSADRF
jgi:hypothetical protein